MRLCEKEGNGNLVKVSVIVPIYNVEKQLERCILSLIEQKTEEISLQIILVNDGSTDNSGKIAKEYAEKYKDIIVYLEKENGGLSDARNFGVKYADGDYISFVDSDDYIDKELYCKLLPYMQKKYDMVKISIQRVKENGEVIEKNYSPEFAYKTGEEAFDILYKTDVMTEVSWGYIYRREFYIENKFEFAKGLYHEDFGLTPLIMLKASKVASTTIGYYNYVQTENSITRGKYSKTVKGASDLIKHYDNMLKTIEKYNISDKSKENLKIYYTNCIILETNNLKGEDRKKYIREIRKRKFAKNIKIRNFKQFIKRIVLQFNVELYLKIR